MAGTFLTLVILNLGLHPDVLRYLAAWLLILVALVLMVKPLENWILSLIHI